MSATTQEAGQAAKQGKTTEQVLDMIEKMLRMTESNGASPEEAASFAAKAQQLMFDHGIEMARVRARTEGKQRASAMDGFVNTEFFVGAKTEWISRWRQELLIGISRANHCRCLIWSNGPSSRRGGMAGKVQIIGRPENVEAVKHLYEYLVKEIWRLCKIETKDERTWRPMSQSHERTFQKSFCLGAVEVVSKRLKEQQQEDIKRTETSALMVVEWDLVNAAQAAFYPTTGKARETRAKDSAGYYAGRKAGAGISLNKQVRG